MKKPREVKHPDLLAEIERFLSHTGMKPTVFGQETINDGKLVSDLRRGRRMWPETIERIRNFIARQSEDAA